MEKALPNTVPKFLWHFAKRQKLRLFGFVLVAIYWSSNMSLTPYAMKMIIDGAAGADANTLHSALLFPASLFIGLGLVLGIVFRFYDWLTLRTFPLMKIEIIDEMFYYVEGHSYSFFQNNFAGSLANKINDMARSSVEIIRGLLDHFLARTLSLIVATITMYFVHPYFAFVLFSWSVLFITIAVFLSRKGVVYSEDFSEARSTVIGKVVDSLTNILNVKLFGRRGYERRYLDESLEDGKQKDQLSIWYFLKVKLFYSLAITLLTCIMMWLLIDMRSKNMVTIGDFALILTLNMFIIEEVFFLANELVPFAEEIGTCKQALSIIVKPHEVVDKPPTIPFKIEKGVIVFDKVHFRYTKEESVFTDKSITIHSGERVGLVGYSGSGKSTFVNLILRFFDVDSGTITIDGQDISKMPQELLRSQIAMIPQDPVLFHRSLMENIRYGRLEASDEEVIDASKKAHCHEFIEHLSEGYNTLVGERGIKLSGGQRQRIAIARAMLKKAPILIFDEATSSLDSVTENSIQKSMASLMEGKTTIVIAHRLSTLSLMNRILVFSKGKVVEDGTHEELLAQKGQYAKLWSMQAGGFLRDQT